MTDALAALIGGSEQESCGPSQFFRLGSVYQTIGTVIVGKPIIIIPKRYLEMDYAGYSREVSRAPSFLFGTCYHYHDNTVLDILGMNRLSADQMGKRVLGAAQLIEDDETPRDLANRTGIRPGQALISFRRYQIPLAFLLHPDESMEQVGIIAYSSPPAHNLIEDASKAVVITQEEIRVNMRMGKLDISPHELAKNQVASPTHSSHSPVLCAYQGRRCTRIAEICPACGVPICHECRDEARGCITVNCPNSLCR